MHSWSGNCHILSLYILKSKESELPDVQCTSHNLVYFVAEASFGSKTNISYELLVLTLYNNNNFYDNRKYKHSKVRFLYIVSDHSFIKCLAVYNISAFCIIIPSPKMSRSPQKERLLVFWGKSRAQHRHSRLKTKSHFPTACSVVEEIEASN